MCMVLNYHTRLTKLYTTQKCAIQTITNSPTPTHSLPHFHKLNTLTITDINHLQTTLFIHDHIYNNLQPNFNDYFKTNNQMHTHYTRQANKLVNKLVPHNQHNQLNLEKAGQIFRFLLISWLFYVVIDNAKLISPISSIANITMVRLMMRWWEKNVSFCINTSSWLLETKKSDLNTHALKDDSVNK